MPSRAIRAVLLTWAVLSACMTAGLEPSRRAASLFAPADPPTPGAFRVMTLNLAHGRGLSFHQALTPAGAIVDNLAAVGLLVAGARPDVVALQEADGVSSWSGGFDHVARVAREGGLAHFFRGRHAHMDALGVELDYGTALVSRMPLAEAWSQPFDTSWRDTKGFVVASVTPEGSAQPVDVVSVHLDFLSDEVRREQLEQMVAVLQKRANPLVILGDLNCEWSSCARELAAALDLRTWQPLQPGPTFPADGPDRRIDWILVSRQIEVVAHRVLEAEVSDHRAVIADLRWRDAT